MTDRGASSVYPVGAPWVLEGGRALQRVSREQLFGPGNCPEVQPGVLECAGIQFPVDGIVEWTARVATGDRSLVFAIELMNIGETCIRNAGAAICLRFLRTDWWSDDGVYVLSGGVVTSLALLGRKAGRPNGFQAYLVEGQPEGNVFYREFWGFNSTRLDSAIVVSFFEAGKLCVGIEADAAYFVHSNPHNPCTDVMLAMGDVDPGDVRHVTGSVWVREGSPRWHLLGSQAPARAAQG